MTTLVLGATGATGRLLVEQLLHRGETVRAIVRSSDRLPSALDGNERLSIVHASILDLSDAEIAQHVEGCDAVASCLGHNMTWRGIYGHPRRLVTDATIRLCNAIKANASGQRVKFVLMNTAGNSNRDVAEPRSWLETCVVGLVRLILPPHLDNEKAADYLRTGIGSGDELIEWAVVRPDSLANADRVTEYELHPSPTRSAIFNAGTTSRINVADFMANLITDEGAWNTWKGRMPVIYDKRSV